MKSVKELVVDYFRTLHQGEHLWSKFIKFVEGYEDFSGVSVEETIEYFDALKDGAKMPEDAFVRSDISKMLNLYNEHLTPVKSFVCPITHEETDVKNGVKLDDFFCTRESIGNLYN